MKPTSTVAAALVVLAVVLSYLTGSTAPHAAPAVVGTAPVVAATLICPVVDSSPTGTSTVATVADVSGALGGSTPSTGTITATTLAGAKSTTSTLKVAPTATIASKTGVDSAIAISATGSVAASVVADQVLETPSGRFRALAGGPCVAPRTDWWFAGIDGRVGYSDSLILANSAKTSAAVTITLWSTKGPVNAAKVASIAIGPQSRRLVKISAVAPNDATLGMRVRAESGAVAAAVVERRTSALSSDGGDLVPPTQPPSTSQLIAGYARGTGNRYLFVANPSPLDATVTLKLVAGSGSFTPSGVNQVVVKSGHTSFINLTQVFGTQTGGVQVTSDQPVIAQGMSSLAVTGLRPDRMWLAAGPPIKGVTAVANGHEPDGGQCLLLLSAPGATATVKVTTPSGRTTTISVPAGKSVETDITSTVRNGTGPWPFTVTSTGGPVYGIRMLNFGGAHGALISGQPLIALPTPISLPPVRSDPRIAVK